MFWFLIAVTGVNIGLLAIVVRTGRQRVKAMKELTESQRQAHATGLRVLEALQDDRRRAFELVARGAYVVIPDVPPVPRAKA